MRENVSRHKTGIGEYGSEPFADTNNKRLDLNDLLERVKLQKKKDSRNNLFIISGVVAAFAVIYLFLSINY